MRNTLVTDVTEKEHRKKPGSMWRWLIGIAGIAALVIATAPMAKTILQEMPWALHHISPLWLLLCLVAQAGVYLCLSEILAVSLSALGYRSVPRRFLLTTGAAFLLANRAIPGLAVAGLAVLVQRLKREDIPAEAGQTVAAAFFGSDYAGFLLLGVFALPFLASGGHLGALHPALLIAGLVVILLVAALLIVAYRVTGLLEKIAGGIGHLLATLRCRPSRADEWADKGKTLVASFRARISDLVTYPKRLLLVCGWALLMHVCEVATLVLAVRAFGGTVAFSVAAAGYVAGNLGAIISFLPGGAGLYEGGMITALHAVGGLPVALSLAATLVYRLLTLWLPMPFALVAVRHAMHEG